MRLSLCFFLVIFATLVHAQRDSLRTYYQAGIAAYEEQNFPLYLDYFEKANNIRPNHPTITYNLASALALNGKTEGCLTVLKHLLGMNANILKEVKKDKDFETVVNLAEFRALEDTAIERSKMVSNSFIREKISVDSTHIEGITYNALIKEYYLGSVNDRALFRTSNSKLTKLISYEENKSIFSVLGVQHHSGSNSVWLCTSALPQMTDYTDALSGYSSVLEYDVKKDSVLTEVVVKGGSAFGDLILSTSGDIYISDGIGNKIHTIKSGESELSLFIDLSATMFNLQGLAFSSDEKYLFISDYIIGILRVDIRDKSVSKIELPTHISEKGIDGLYFKNGSLIAIQNGTSPFRVLQLALNQQLDKVTHLKILDQARPELNEPTQGVVVEKEFRYIANSPWNAYNKQNGLDQTKVNDLILLSSKLK